MILQHVRPLFWDANLENFDPTAYPLYTIGRVLEHGDEDDVAWLLRVFTKEQIDDVLRTDPSTTASTPDTARGWSSRASWRDSLASTPA